MNLKIVWKTIGARLDSVLFDCANRLEVVAYVWSTTTTISSFISRLLPVSRLRKMASKNPPPPQKKIKYSCKYKNE